jgi:hypothetical protein
MATRRREILLPKGIRLDTLVRCVLKLAQLVSIARGRRWLDELIADATASAECIAKRVQRPKGEYDDLLAGR